MVVKTGSVSVTLRMPADVMKALKSAADADDRSVSYVAVRALREWMHRPSGGTDPAPAVVAPALVPAPAVKAPKKPAKASTPSTRAPRGGTGILQETIEAVSAILREVGRPVQTEDLLPRLETRGMIVGGKNPRKTLYARLHRIPSLAHVRNEGWSLKAES